MSNSVTRAAEYRDLPPFRAPLSTMRRFAASATKRSTEQNADRIRTRAFCRLCWYVPSPSMALRSWPERGVRPGNYVALDRQWSEGDTISFVLPMSFKLRKYTGVDQIEGKGRFALEYGPLLMAAIGTADVELTLIGASSPMDMAARLQPVKDRQLHFTMYSFSFGAAGGETEFVPYFEIGTVFMLNTAVIAAIEHCGEFCGPSSAKWTILLRPSRSCDLLSSTLLGSQFQQTLP
jgi:hypothetical protein